MEPKIPSLVAFGISVLKPGGALDINRLFIRPETALKCHPKKFLEFADAVQKVAQAYRTHTAQLRMFSDEKEQTA